MKSIRGEVTKAVISAYVEIHKKHSYTLELMHENMGSKGLEGFAFARGKESGIRDAMKIFDNLLAELKAMSINVENSHTDPQTP